MRKRTGYGARKSILKKGEERDENSASTDRKW